MEEQFETNQIDEEIFSPEAQEVPNPDPTPQWEQTNANRYTPEPPKKKGLSGGRLVALILCVCLLGTAIGAIGTRLADHNNTKDSKLPTTDLSGLLSTKPTAGEDHSATILEGDRENTVIDKDKVETGKLMTPAEVYAANVNATVGITTSITTNYWGYPTTSAASGSGFILTDNGYIVTNHHVVEDSDSITVSFYDGTSASATLIGSDEANDIAVLKVDKTGLTPVVLGDSANMNVGDSVAAIGNPLGELTFSLTTGIVSALNRDVTMSNGITMTLIQTDCAINSGNSGGALFNMYGEVIGITNAKYSSSSSGASIDNIAFAIPMNDVRSMIEGIIKNGYLSKPYLGISVLDVDERAQAYGLPKGAAIQLVAEDSPAEKAKLQVNDIITHANGEEISTSSDLITLVKKSNVGDSLQLTVYRKGATLEITVIIGEQKG